MSVGRIVSSVAGLLWLLLLAGSASGQGSMSLGSGFGRAMEKHPELLENTMRVWPVLMKLEPIANLLEQLASIDGMKDLVVQMFASPELTQQLKDHVIRAASASANTTTLMHGTRPLPVQDQDMAMRIKLGEEMAQQQLGHFPSFPLQQLQQQLQQQRYQQQMRIWQQQQPQDAQQQMHSTPRLTQTAPPQQQNPEPYVQTQPQPIPLQSMPLQPVALPPQQAPATDAASQVPEQPQTSELAATTDTQNQPDVQNAPAVALTSAPQPVATTNTSTSSSSTIDKISAGVTRYSSAIEIVFNVISMILFVRFYLCNMHNYIAYCNWPGQDPLTHAIVDMCCWGRGALLFLSNKRQVNQWRWPGVGCACTPDEPGDKSLQGPDVVTNEDNNKNDDDAKS